MSKRLSFLKVCIEMITIYHNTKCKTSRDVLDLIVQSGQAHQVVMYLETPPNETELREIIRACGGSVRDILRQKGTPYDELDLGNPKWSDDELIAFILKHPILMNRPIVINDCRGALCRPIDKVLEFLD
jgi:arsenate reductase